MAIKMTIKVKNLKREYSNEKVFYDPSFQRRVVWSTNETNKFFEALTRGWVNHPLTLASNKACMVYSDDCADDVSVNYYIDVINKGFEKTSLDGQNRTKKIIAFLDNEFTITGKLEDADGVSVSVENKYFKDLPVRLRDAINDAGVDIVIHDRELRCDLPKIFQDINSGIPLNDHGKRQSIDTPAADWVRGLSKKHSYGIERVVSKKHIPYMADDELVAKIAMVLMTEYKDKNLKDKQWNLGSKDIDQWYQMGQGYYDFTDASSPYLLREKKKVENIIHIVVSTFKQQEFYKKSKTIPRRICWAVVHVCEWLYTNDYVIYDYTDFLSKIKEIDDLLCSEGETECAHLRASTIARGEDPDEIKSGGYYHQWVRVPHQAKNRNARKDKLIARIKEELNALSLRKKWDLSRAA